MDRYVKDGNTYTVGEAQGMDATLLIHRNFNADGSPKSGDDPERPC